LSTRGIHCSIVRVTAKLLVLKYRLAIFDSDGTLADTLPWMRNVFNELADEYHFRRVAPEEFGRYRDLHGKALLDTMQLPLWKLPIIVRAMRKRMALYDGELHPFPGVPGMLRELRDGGIEVAIVSSNARCNVERILGPENTALVNQFSCGVSMFGKAVKLKQLIARSDVSPHEAIYIGDEIRDGEAARKAGVTFGAVAWGQHSEAALRAQQPEHFFNSVPDIARVLLDAKPLRT
jgi:phosphoglycolate phosphatase